MMMAAPCETRPSRASSMPSMQPRSSRLVRCALNPDKPRPHAMLRDFFASFLRLVAPDGKNKPERGSFHACQESFEQQVLCLSDLDFWREVFRGSGAVAPWKCCRQDRRVLRGFRRHFHACFMEPREHRGDGLAVTTGTHRARRAFVVQEHARVSIDAFSTPRQGFVESYFGFSRAVRGGAFAHRGEIRSRSVPMATCAAISVRASAIHTCITSTTGTSGSFTYCFSKATRRPSSSRRSQRLSPQTRRRPTLVPPVPGRPTRGERWACRTRAHLCNLLRSKHQARAGGDGVNATEASSQPDLYAKRLRYLDVPARVPYIAHCLQADEVSCPPHRKINRSSPRTVAHFFCASCTRSRASYPLAVLWCFTCGRTPRRSEDKSHSMQPFAKSRTCRICPFSNGA